MNSKKQPWSKEEYNLLEKVIALVEARKLSSYPDLDDECGIAVNEDGDTVVPMENFADELVRELQTIQDGGRTMIDYSIDEARGNIAGMMGLDKHEDECV